MATGGVHSAGPRPRAAPCAAACTAQQAAGPGHAADRHAGGALSAHAALLPVQAADGGAVSEAPGLRPAGGALRHRARAGRQRPLAGGPGAGQRCSAGLRTLHPRTCPHARDWQAEAGTVVALYPGIVYAATQYRCVAPLPPFSWARQQQPSTCLTPSWSDHNRGALTGCRWRAGSCQATPQCPGATTPCWGATTAASSTRCPGSLQLRGRPGSTCWRRAHLCPPALQQL